MHHAFIQVHYDARLVIILQVQVHYLFSLQLLYYWTYNTELILHYCTRHVKVTYSLQYFPVGIPQSHSTAVVAVEITDRSPAQICEGYDGDCLSTFPIFASHWALLTQNPFTTVLDRPL